MPLQQGSSDRVVSSNVAKLIREGYKRSQAVAIAKAHSRRKSAIKKKRYHG